MKHLRIPLTVAVLWLTVSICVIQLHPIQAAQRVRLLTNEDDAVDAVQNRRLDELDHIVMAHTTSLVELQAESNWLKGGGAVIVGLFTIVQVIMPLLKKGS